MTSYRAKDEILENAYAEFVTTEAFSDALLQIDEINPELAKAIDVHGIGTGLLADGSYDFECGQLYEGLEQHVKLSSEDKDLITDIAYDYQFYAQGCLETETES